MIKQFYLQNDDEFLATVTYSGESDKACAIFVHSYTNWKDEHDYMFCRIAKRLAKENIASVLFDMRGHGDSSGDLENTGLDTMIQDVQKITEYVKKNISDKFFYVTAGFAARVAVEADIENENSGCFCLYPAFNIPERLKELSKESGKTFTEVLVAHPQRKEIENNMTRMGLLVLFVSGEIINDAIFSVSNYQKQSKKQRIMSFINQDETNYTDTLFDDVETVKFDEGGILLRSPKVIDSISTMIAESMNAKIYN